LTRKNVSVLHETQQDLTKFAVCSLQVYARKYDGYDLLSFYYMQNNADSTTTLRIGHNSELF